MPPRPQARPMPTATIAKHRNLPSRPSRKSDSTAGATTNSSTRAEREPGRAPPSGCVSRRRHARLLVRTLKMPCGRTCRKATISDEDQHLGDADAVVEYSNHGLQHAEHERGDHRALDLPDAADHDHQEGVDDVVGAQGRRRSSRAGSAPPRRRRPGRSRRRRSAGRWRRVEMPGALGQVAVLHRGPDPPAERGEPQHQRSAPATASDGQRQDEQPGAREGERRAARRGPDSQLGRPDVARSAAPKMSRASCCRTSETPQVTSRVSSGRWYIRRSSVTSSSTPEQTADQERDRQRHQQRDAGVGEHLLHDERGVGAGHDELAVRHVDDAHLAEGQRQAERGEQQHRADADSR